MRDPDHAAEALAKLDRFQREAPTAVEAVLLELPSPAAAQVMAGSGAGLQLAGEPAAEVRFTARSSIDRRVASRFGHTPTSVIVAACAARQVVSLMGRPYSDLIPPTVLRWLGDDGPGALQALPPAERHRSRARARAIDQAALGASAIDLSAAALVDAVIGHAGRRARDVRVSDGILLLDNGTSFPRRGDIAVPRELLRWRWDRGDRALTEAEQRSLASLLASPRLLGLLEVLGPARYDAFVGRTATMLATRTIVRGASTWRLRVHPAAGWRW
jgi:hypothetical protein